MVDLNKVFNALKWLKENNPICKQIILPNTPEELCLNNMKENEFKIEKDENTEKNNLKSDVKINKIKLENKDYKNNKGMMSEVNENDNYYEQYTIYPLYEKKINKSVSALYQMLKIEELPINNREKSLDLLCFPDLFPFGKNGQHENRKIRLLDHEYIKLRDYLKAVQNELLEANINAIFSTLRNTEQFWRKPKNDLNCMIHHYGPATWFLTLSPSEWLWEDLEEYIREINNWKNESININELIARDPVSTSRFLENKFQGIIDFICANSNPIGKVKHYFWRREYQGKGIQHFHIIIWIENAPIIGESTSMEVGDFITKHISCKIPNSKLSPILYKRVITHQQHKHNDYCLRNKKIGRKVVRICRFGFPRRITKTFLMRDVISAIASRKQLKQKSRLYDLPRTEKEKNINDYNPILLTAWEGNMDIQFIGEKSNLVVSRFERYIPSSGLVSLARQPRDKSWIG
ncbi:uncharacterized protein [Cardiocondyla obscurior]|uniref:uncharacterized protein n=1 Tax=Cardiocondyla obscurior TaxID=286306 RepID=UPI0039656775